LSIEVQQIGVGRRLNISAPDNWRTVRLADVADMRLGKMLDAQKNRGNLHPYLRNPNVRWFQLDLADLKEMRFEIEEEEKFSIRDGDVIICEGGEAGRAAVWSGPDIGVKFQKAIHRVRPGPALFNRFLVHQLFYDYHSGVLSDYYTGATISHLTGQDLARYEIALPPLDEQRRIVAILDQVDDLRRKRREALDQLQQLKSISFKTMFLDPQATEFPWGRIQDLTSSTQYGTSVKAGDRGEFPILRMGNLTYEGEIDTTGLKYLDLPTSDVDKYTVAPGDILFNRTNSPDLVGKTAIFREREVYAFAGYLVRLRVNDRADPEFVSGYLNSKRGKAVLRGMCKAIIGMANINAQELRRIPIPIPPLNLQRTFAARVAEIDKLKTQHRAHLAKLDALFASLQHRAFRGEL